MGAAEMREVQARAYLLVGVVAGCLSPLGWVWVCVWVVTGGRGAQREG